MHSLLACTHSSLLALTLLIQVPGSYYDALNGNTRLGKAVRAACDELNSLNNLASADEGIVHAAPAVFVLHARSQIHQYQMWLRLFGGMCSGSEGATSFTARGLEGHASFKPFTLVFVDKRACRSWK